MVSSTPRLQLTPGKDRVPILEEAGWAPGPVWTGEKSRLHRDSIPDRAARISVAIPTELPGPQLPIRTRCICNHALHDLSLNMMTHSLRLTRGFIIRYFTGHTK